MKGIIEDQLVGEGVLGEQSPLRGLGDLDNLHHHSLLVEVTVVHTINVTILSYDLVQYIKREIPIWGVEAVSIKY